MRAVVYILIWIVIAMAAITPLVLKVPTTLGKIVVVWLAITVLTGVLELVFLLNHRHVKQIPEQEHGSPAMCRQVTLLDSLSARFWARSYTGYCASNPSYCRDDAIIVHELQHMIFASIPALIVVSMCIYQLVQHKSIDQFGKLAAVLLIIIGLTQFMGTSMYWTWWQWTHGSNANLNRAWLLCDVPYFVFGLIVLCLGGHLTLKQ